MQRKLISYDAFKKIKDSSLTYAEFELSEAEEIVAKAIDVDALKLECFDDSTVVYETEDGTHIHASYDISDDYITFENIEELVINEEDEHSAAKAILEKMVENILDGNNSKAESLFNEYINLPLFRHVISEVAIVGSVAAPTKRAKTKGRRQPRSVVEKRRRARMKSLRRRSPSQKRQAASLRKRLASKLPSRKGARVYIRYKDKPKMHKTMKEWANLSSKVFEYVDFLNYGPAIRESFLKHDPKGNVIALKVPTSKVRNEGKILSFDWKTLNAEVKVLRESAKQIVNDATFLRAANDLKKANNLADNKAFQVTLEHVVEAWPNLIFLTRAEISSMIEESLKAANVKNFDDEVCDFIAEAVLRTSFSMDQEKASHLLKVARAEPCDENCEDPYAYFESVVNEFYPSLDQTLAVETKVFEDLYSTMVEVNKVAKEVGDEALVSDCMEYLRELASVLNGEVEADIELAEEVADWLYELVETNLETSDWDVSNTPHITVTGEHPRASEIAAKSYSPSADASGDWGPEPPALDDEGKTYRSDGGSNLRNKGFANIGGKDVYPDLKNPYVPDAIKPTVKNEKPIDKDDDLGTWQSADTWPNLSNTYVPKAIAPWKMKSDNLVIDQK